ncbi:MAG: glycosyltransferase [Planctomycetota bacterium]
MTTSARALLIDASEWFVDEVFREHVRARHWRRLPRRSAFALRHVAERLRDHGGTATLFVPVELAESTNVHERQLLVELVRLGHELALSVRTEKSLDEIRDHAERTRLIDGWMRQRAVLEELIGVGIHGFAAAWSVAKSSQPRWWHAALRDQHFAYDATPVREDAAAILSFDGRAVPVERFQAWRLDGEQPRLMGLPLEVRRRHEDRMSDGERALETMRQRAWKSLAGVLELPPGPVTIAPDLPTKRVRLAKNAVPLTIVVPLKDEADGISSLFDELEAVTVDLADVADCRFVLIDDGSTDATWPQLEHLARNRRQMRLVRHEVNRGVAAAIRTGVLAAETELVASIDGDLSYDPLELRAMLPLIADADVVTASPYHAKGRVHNVPGWRLFLSRTLSLAYRILLMRPIRTWTSCFRLYRRDAVADLPLAHPGFLGTAELLVRVLRRKGRVVEHPCTLEARLIGFSKMRVFGTCLDHLKLLVKVALRIVR